MSIAETVQQKVAKLSADRQRDVLAFVERLERSGERAAVQDPYGLLCDGASDLPLEEFQRARWEMAGAAPRDLPAEGE